MRRIGFVVNPIAGMGGNVGLKGTDGTGAEAIRRGAVPHASERASAALKQVTAAGIMFLTCSGKMGEDALRSAGIPSFSVVCHPPASTTADDTKRACRKFLDEQVDLILFCGGDGTARDVYDVVGSTIPVLGIPAGVKMYSAVFAIDPAAAGAVIEKAGELPLRDAEVLDVNEDAYRAGILSTRLYGIARVPVLEDRMQVSKRVIEERDEERAKKEIARFMAEVMDPDRLYILGAGTTTEAIAHRLGISKTLLGVDALKGTNIVAPDADEKTLLSLLTKEDSAGIIVSPIGAQGFVFGRGSQQISADVIRQVGIRNVIVVATPAKCLETPVLHIDTGDPALDAEFKDSIQVITGYRIAQRKKIQR
jgi:predicted polyphosphate/ATP-dependent NAD kinase